MPQLLALQMEQVTQDLRNLGAQDFGATLPLAISVNGLLSPDESMENCHRQIQFISFELKQDGKGLDTLERWHLLRDYLFVKKEFNCESNLWLKTILQNRSGHPLVLGLLVLHLAHQLDIPLQLVQARHHYISRLVLKDKTYYFDLLNRGQMMSDDDLVKALHRSASNLESWTARQLLIGYLEELSRQFELNDDWSRLLMVYDLYLHLDENATSVIGLRGLLRFKLGLAREAMSDLKRYFSFVDKNHAPIEIQMALHSLEQSAPYQQPQPLLH